MWYQPKIDLQRKCLGGAEVELRFSDGQVGRLQGAGGAGEDGLTEQVLLLALAQWETFQQAGFPLRLAINMPLRALLSLPLAPLIDECRPRSEQWPGIVLEISEGEVMRDLKPVQEVVERLRVSGVDLAIGDFGAGYSSLANLRGLGFVELKLDRSFVAGCAADTTNAAICQTAVDLAHRFGSAAVAQGIDRGDDLRALMAMGCNLGQGPLLAPSMSQRKFLALLRQRAR
ncbi:MAG: EAL domain-containing protein [Hyphomicrobiales bacterium]|nr:EAL domain-containing protein [Hyphomicrobiales bacterium]